MSFETIKRFLKENAKRESICVRVAQDNPKYHFVKIIPEVRLIIKISEF